MTCNEIYAAALKLIGEVADAGRTEDYESRAPYIIAGFISDMRKLDNAYRKANGIESTDVGDTVYIELEKEFPLSDRFCMAAEFYLASMLLIDENSELSDTLYDRFCSAVTTITSEIPAVVEKIKDKYFFGDSII